MHLEQPILCHHVSSSIQRSLFRVSSDVGNSVLVSLYFDGVSLILEYLPVLGTKQQYNQEVHHEGEHDHPQQEPLNVHFKLVYNLNLI